MGPFGLGEIIVIAMLALVVLGPEKFPEFAKIAMRAFRDLRGYVDDIKREMAEEVKPLKQEIQSLSQYDPEEYLEPFAEAMTSVDAEPASESKQEAKTEAEKESADTVSPYREEVAGEGHSTLETEGGASKPAGSASREDEYPD